MPKLVAPDGVKIDYDDEGTGEPALLFMTAWCMSRSIYAGMIPLLAKKRRVLALDWRGHGESERPKTDFGAEDLINDCIALIEKSGVEKVIPVTSSHAGWIGIELRNRLGDNIPKIALLDWLLFPPPPEYVELVQGLNDENRWEATRDILFSIWLEGVNNEDVIHFIKDEMGSYGVDTWMRSGREIGGCYQRGGSPILALQSMDPKIPILHVYAQPNDPGYLKAQQDFSAANPWFSVERVNAKSHFPSFEVPEAIAGAIEDFASQP